MKDFDPLQMLTTVYLIWEISIAIQHTYTVQRLEVGMIFFYASYAKAAFFLIENKVKTIIL